MRIGDFYNFKGILLQVARKRDATCEGCYFKENNINCTKYSFECYRIKLVEVKKPHLYGDFTAFQKIEAFVKQEISEIDSDLSDMEECEIKENTKVLLEQYLEILKRIEG